MGGVLSRAVLGGSVRIDQAGLGPLRDLCRGSQDFQRLIAMHVIVGCQADYSLCT